ncbi:MAG: NADH-quinone oxidoreductase subunit C [Deltaproteobacteria bacterium]|nr:NADH-quinone oxidoreductase subunit C [Deltaproteobacteria bacterium]MBI2975072.1 NADH-quinone oxidoreductase subunit C [Deltaproteobacteria bacterium]
MVEVCKTLRDDYKFDCLSCLTGIDLVDYFEVVYHLFSYSEKKPLVLKVKLEKQSSTMPSVSAIWPSANWMEREVFDLLGIKFENHPDLRRIMLPEDWAGHPLQKSYKEPEEYCGMSTKR